MQASIITLKKKLIPTQSIQVNRAVDSVESNILKARLQQVRQRIHDAETKFGRKPGTTRLLAVSKTRSADEIRAVAQLGQQAFGESYPQEAMEKIKQLDDLHLEWHFIGRLQSNKTKIIAEHFA